MWAESFEVGFISISLHKPYEGFAPFGAAVWNNVQEKVAYVADCTAYSFFSHILTVCQSEHRTNSFGYS